MIKGINRRASPAPVLCSLRSLSPAAELRDSNPLLRLRSEKMKASHSFCPSLVVIKFVIACICFMVGAAAIAEAGHQDHFLVFNGYALKSNGPEHVTGGAFVGFFWGFVGLEYARLEAGASAASDAATARPVLFQGIAFQPVILPLGGPGGPFVMPWRLAFSLGSLDGAVGGRVGFNIVHQFTRREVYNIFTGMSLWMNTDGLSIPTIEIGFGF